MIMQRNITKLINDLYIENAKLKDKTKASLAKMFEWYTCYKLTDKYNRPFYHYSDIDPDFKEKNYMSYGDTGIDACDLRYCIVQCKLRSGSLQYGECSTTFASQNSYCDITNAIIVRWPEIIIARNDDSKLSANMRGHNAKRFIDMRYNVKEMLEFCATIIPSPEIMPLYETRDYQTEAIKLINSDCKFCIISLPTGTGKNYIIIKSMKPGCKYLILVPLIVLMEQICQEIIKLLPSAAQNAMQMLGDGNVIYDPSALITICCYKSVHYITDMDSFDKIFIDEAHHIYPPGIYAEEEEVINVEKPLLQSADIFGEAEFIAPPRNYLDIIRDIKENVVCLSATIDSISGSTYFSRDIRQMITDKYLCDYAIYVPIFIRSGHASICSYLIQNHDSIIIYCANKKEGHEINKILNDLCPGCCKYIDCDTKKGYRDNAIKKFRNQELRFLVNIRILTEGFDAPCCKGVCFIHMPKSRTMTVQIIGRCLRLHSSKIIAKVILPYSTEDDDSAINSFLKVISENDSRIRISNENKQLGGYINIFPGYDEVDTGEYELKYLRIYDSLGRLNGCVDYWMHKLDEVKDYIDANGTRPSSDSKDKEIKQLGQWLLNQKKNYDKNINIMKDEVIRKHWHSFITDIKYSFYFLSNEELWLHKLQECRNYIDINKKCPSQMSKDNEIKQLGSWLSHQKKNYDKNLQIMKDEEIRKHWIAFITDIKYSFFFLYNEELWLHHLEECRNYIDINKKRPSKTSKDEDIKQLGSWLSNQKKNYDKNINIMKDKEICKHWISFITDPAYIQYF